MPTVGLTDRFCATVKGGAGRVDYFDETVSGLALRVTEHGRRTWCFHFRSPRDGKRARYTIGTYPATTLAAARGKALEARASVEAGKDPRLVHASRGVAQMTLSDLVRAFLSDPEKAELRSLSEIRRRVEKNVTPLIGAIRINELRKRDARTVTDAILARGRKVEATRVFEDLRSIIRWGLENEYLDINPLEGMGKPAEATVSNRVLTDEELRTVWTTLPKALARSKQVQRIIRLCVVTAQRVGEVSGITRAELDLKAREWRLSGARTKNGHPHVVPLSDLAIEIIDEALEAAGKRHELFPTADEGSLSPAAVARTILRAQQSDDERPLGRFGTASWSAHDLRRTALTGMARLGVAPVVLGHVANHRTTTRAGVTLAVYSQYTYDREKREALDLWALRVTAIIESNVVQLQRAGA